MKNEMKNDKANDRAVLPSSGIIDARSLASSNRRLAELLTPGMTVLDVGCGTGAITSGIADQVGPMGKVVGIDNNPEWIAKARQTYAGRPGLSFEVGDIYNLPYHEQFDLVTCARVLQWLACPDQALQQMVRSVRPGGTVQVLDYNHEKIKWEPEIPASMANFYASFLRWRSDAGMDNSIADHLAELFAGQGLTRIGITNQHESVYRHSPGFLNQVLIWAEVAAFKGSQMVQDGYLTEKERKEAEWQYRQWAKEQGMSQVMYLLSVEGIKK